MEAKFAKILEKYAGIKKEVGNIKFIEDLVQKYKTGPESEKAIILDKLQKTMDENAPKRDIVYLVNRTYTIPDGVEVIEEDSGDLVAKVGGLKRHWEMLQVSLFLLIFFVIIVAVKRSSESTPIALSIGDDL